MPERSRPLDRQLQALDVHIVDVLAHLEALLRHSHSTQRLLLRLRAEAPPPASTPGRDVPTELRERAQEMLRECDMLAEILRDLSVGVEELPLAR